jgi:hypothetical protein
MYGELTIIIRYPLNEQNYDDLPNDDRKYAAMVEMDITDLKERNCSLEDLIDGPMIITGKACEGDIPEEVEVYPISERPYEDKLDDFEMDRN